MTQRERFLRTMAFEEPDRTPNHELGLWGQTYERWLGEGAPEEALNGNWFDGIDYFGMDRREFVPLNMGMIPPFDTEILEESDRYVVARHGNGVVTRALKEGTVRGTRWSMDTYLRFPVETPEDFVALKARYDSGEPARYPGDWDACVAAWGAREHPLCLLTNAGVGLYSNCRTWMGTENLSYAFHDQPKLVHEMIDFIADFTIETLHRALEEVEIDYFNWFEDFAYKTGPLLSPTCFREFLLPRYQRVNEFLRSHGVKIITLDSDGNVEVLIPLLLEAGITGIWPCEIAAEMHPQKIRQQYGHALALAGGIDKRELGKGPKAIEQELIPKLPELLEDGGYIPTVDHTVPPEVSWQDFLYYMDLKRRCLAGEFGA